QELSPKKNFLHWQKWLVKKILLTAALMLLTTTAEAQQYWPSYQYDLPHLQRPPVPYPTPRRFGPQDVRRVEIPKTFVCTNKLVLQAAIHHNDTGTWPD